ncbi:hypothetical protein [Actinoplanes sp. NPDC051851]|uniref:hypothetical protein n=1 Tax=Actinoplanes sp. NPDC051851 TaxID=3154753 RepID=UPI00341D8BDF
MTSETWPESSLDSSASWPAGDARLERHYRRLTLAYSGQYRRRHGDEIVTTLLEMAEPGRERPSASEAWHLIASGVRQRFRVPRRPFALVATVLVTLVTGVFGAAAGSWFGEKTFTELPSKAATVGVLEAAMPDAADDAMWIIRNSEAGNADFLTLGTSPGERESASAWTIEQARDGLAAAGWRTSDFQIFEVTTEDKAWAEAQSVVLNDRSGHLTAERDGLIMNLNMTDGTNGEPGKASIGGTMFAARSTAYVPLVAGGALLGGIAGWLLVAALAYRIRTTRPGRGQVTGVFAGIALAASVLPVWAVVLNAVLLGETFTDRVRSVFTLHAALMPGYVQGAPAWLIPGSALLAVAAATIAITMAWGDDSGEPRNAAPADLPTITEA